MTNDATHKTWSGRFDEPVSERVKRYTASIPFDWRLWRHDIQGSLAHARMLAKQGIISTEDLAAIERGMAQIAQEIESGAFEWSLDDEDIHLNIERRLTALVGDAGKRLHTGRSRNDQVATGGDRHPSLVARRDRRDPQPHSHAANGTLGPCRTACGDADARIHPSAGGTTGHLRPPPHGLRGDAGARLGAAHRLPPPHQPLASGRCRTCRHHLPDRSVGRCRNAWFRRVVSQFARCGERPRFRDRILECGQSGDDASLALFRRIDPVDDAPLRVHRLGGPLLHRQLDHAAEEEPTHVRRRRTQTFPNWCGAKPDASMATSSRCSR